MGFGRSGVRGRLGIIWEDTDEQGIEHSSQSFDGTRYPVCLSIWLTI